MPARDETAWEVVEGDHGDDLTYARLRGEPTATPTDEVRTAEEVGAAERKTTREHRRASTPPRLPTSTRSSRGSTSPRSRAPASMAR